MKKILSTNVILLSCLIWATPRTHAQKTPPPSTAPIASPAATPEPPPEPEPPALIESGKVRARNLAQSGGAGVFGGGGGGFGGVAGQDVFFDGNNPATWLDGKSQPGGRTLVIRSPDADEKANATLDEDLKIMAKILDKAMDTHRDESAHKAMGITVFGAPGGSVRNLYLDGYGALFLLNVHFPLLAPPEKSEEPKSKEPTSSTWEETKNELYGGHPEPGGFQKFKVRTRPAEPYDSQKVEALQESILEALKNATHIRKLKADDFVTIVVSGGSAGGRTMTTVHTMGSGTISKSESDRVNWFRFGDGPGMAESTMTIRAKKSDIDSYSKDKIDLAAFKKKAQISIY